MDAFSGRLPPIVTELLAGAPFAPKVGAANVRSPCLALSAPRPLARRGRVPDGAHAPPPGQPPARGRVVQAPPHPGVALRHGRVQRPAQGGVRPRARLGEGRGGLQGFPLRARARSGVGVAHALPRPAGAAADRRQRPHGPRGAHGPRRGGADRVRQAPRGDRARRLRRRRDLREDRPALGHALRQERGHPPRHAHLSARDRAPGRAGVRAGQARSAHLRRATRRRRRGRQVQGPLRLPGVHPPRGDLPRALRVRQRAPLHRHRRPRADRPGGRRQAPGAHPRQARVARARHRRRARGARRRLRRGHLRLRRAGHRSRPLPRLPQDLPGRQDGGGPRLPHAQGRRGPGGRPRLPRRRLVLRPVPDHRRRRRARGARPRGRRRARRRARPGRRERQVLQHPRPKRRAC